LLNPAVGQGQVFFIAAFLGLGAAGGLRAMQLPSLVMTQGITAIGLLFLPVLAGDHGRGAIAVMRLKSMQLSAGLAGVSLCFAAFLAIFSSRLEQILFGGKYATYAWLMPILALVPVANAFSIGYSMALRASQKPQFDLLANLVAAPVALLSALCFIPRWGLAGAASSMMLGFITLGAVTIVWFRKGK
jgi:O-antigen/teichoic acid export membrane protein